MMKKSTKNEIRKIIITLIQITLIGFVIAAVIVGSGMIKLEPETKPDVVYAMANTNIKWSGAGYNGLWGNK